ncbi:hypothetical protein DID76_01630 [Candidatus Marinamargulisbacteria bacterium SCGC AG-414-C22]|nr:hypothetical protein DID76_01630 [Candidatus Marinamargulisbacteria bacterium SCGC AG-414-C22]
MGDAVIKYDKTEPNSLNVTYAVLVTVVFLAVIIVFSVIFYRSELSIDQNAKQDNYVKHPYIESIEKEARKELNSLKWINKQAGQIQLPLSIAKDQVVKDYQ